MEFPETNRQAQNRIDYQFIVVYNKASKHIAKSLHNQAVGLKIKSTAWSKKEFLDQESRLTNYNHIVFLSETLIKENLSNPRLQERNIIPGVLYKYEGNSIGLFLDSKVDFVETAKKVGKSLKEDWLKEVGVIIATGLVGVGVYSVARFFTKKKKAELYLSFRGVDKFSESMLSDFVSDKLQ